MFFWVGVFQRSFVPLYGKSHKIGNCELVDPSFLRAFDSRRNGVLRIEWVVGSCSVNFSMCESLKGH